LKRNRTFDNEFADVQEFPRQTGTIRNGEFDVFDGKSSIFNDFGRTDLNVQFGIAFLEFVENVFLDFVVDSEIDEEPPGGCPDDNEQRSPAESGPNPAQNSHAEV
jgi:hypothetical protein